MMSKRRHSSAKENEEREPYYEKKSRFERLNDKLLEERNRNRDEIEGLQNELNEKNRTFEQKIKLMEEVNVNLANDVVKERNECDKWKKSYEHRVQEIEEFIRKNNVYKEEQKNILEIERNKCKHFEHKFIIVSKEKEELVKNFNEEKKIFETFKKDSLEWQKMVNELKNENKKLIEENKKIRVELNNEKKKNVENSDFNKTINELNKNLEIQKNINKKQSEDYKRSAVNLKNNLMKESLDLKRRLNKEMNSNRVSDGSQQIIDDLNTKCNDLKTRLEEQIQKSNKETEEHKSAVTQMKFSFNSQLTALKKQRNYFKNCNEMNKRKHLSTQYLHFGHQMMYRKNTTKIHESTEINTNNVFAQMKTRVEELIDEYFKKLNEKNSQSVADVVRENVIESEEITIGANSIAKRRVDERVPCPICEDKTFSNAGNWRKHMAVKHFFKFDAFLNNSSGLQNKVIDTIDIEDD